MYASHQPSATCTLLQQAGSYACPGAELINAGPVQGSKFCTTESFTTTHGFVITAAPLSALPSPSGRLQQSAAGSHHSRSTQAAESSQPRQPSTPVGWSGLLEISRAAGTPGVVGSMASADVMELEGTGHIEVTCMAHVPHGVRRLVKSVIRGLKARQEPEAAREGMGGTYFFPNEAGRKCAIFKPCDEEPLAPANPKGYVGRALGDPGWKSTVRVGEAAMREVAAYLLDHNHFAQVPHTVLVQAQHPLFNYNYKEAAAAPLPGGDRRDSSLRTSSSTSSACSMAVSEPSMPSLLQQQQESSSDGSRTSGSRPLKLGSLQEFIYHIADTNDFGASRFRTRDVHAIGILDIRLFNTDRHAGNILVREPASSSASRDSMSRSSSRANFRTHGEVAAAVVASGSYELVPIDHGFCLPEALEAPYFEWLHWPQACLPFDEEELLYIASLDVQKDIELLQQELPNLRPECLRVLEIGTTLLQCCAAAGLSLADIGALASRPLDALDGDDSCPSQLEQACIAARQAVETRELTAMLSSSCSSDGTFTLREEEEDDLADSDLADEQSGADGEGRQQGGCQQQQLATGGVRAASRLAVMGSCSMLEDAAVAVYADAAAEAALDSTDATAATSQVVVEVVSGDVASMVSEGTTCALGTAMSLGSVLAARVPVDADLLFDLDDDGSSSSAVTTPGFGGCSEGGLLVRSMSVGVKISDLESMGAAAASSTALANQAGSVSSMDAEQLSMFLSSAQLLPTTGSNASDSPDDPAAGAMPCLSGTASSLALAVPPAYARSMQLGDNDAWIFRQMKAKASAVLVGRSSNSKKPNAVAAAAAAGRRRSGIHVQRVMYPPPVVRAAPRATNEVLSGLSDEQWKAFMAELVAYMRRALMESGAWRQASKAAGLPSAAMSCPRF